MKEEEKEDKAGGVEKVLASAIWRSKRTEPNNFLRGQGPWADSAVSHVTA